jgi:predicted Zn-dependent peptidase
MTYIDHWLNEAILNTKINAMMDLTVLKKSGFKRKTATLTIPFGSEHVSINRGSSHPQIFPEGTAHFLEHMLFEGNGGNISKRFAEVGANVNAFTTHNKTVLYFSTTNGIIEPLMLLFDMLADIAFPVKGIRKEQSIIEKEIMLYHDDVDQRLYYDILQSMYHHHPIKADIAGTSQSLQLIDKKTLQDAFSIFYHPSQLHLVIGGDFAIEPVIDELNHHRYFQPRAPLPFIPLPPAEPVSVVHPSRVIPKDVRNDIMMLGIKIQAPLATLRDAMLFEIKVSLLIDLFFDLSAKNTDLLQRKASVNNTFSHAISIAPDYQHILFYLESSEPDTARTLMDEMVTAMASERINREALKRIKRRTLGDFLRIFDSVSHAVALLSELHRASVKAQELMHTVDRVHEDEIQLLSQCIAKSPRAWVHYRPDDSGAR